MNNITNQFSELLSNPLGELISSIGKGVGEAQAALDEGSLAQTLAVYQLDETKPEEEQQRLKILREIGYQPTFYVIPETEVEAQVSLSLNIKNNVPESIGGVKQSKYQVMATPLNANNINAYNLNANAAAKIKFKIVPVPSMAGEYRIVPDLAGKTLEEATNLMQSIGLDIKATATSLATGVIISQVPDKNSFTKQGETIMVTIE
jgi:hypothetical protein